MNKQRYLTREARRWFERNVREMKRRYRRRRGHHSYWMERGYLALAFEAETVEYLAPKAEWGDGPWQNERDYAAWEHPAGLRCFVRRNHHGSFCGYVTAPSREIFRKAASFDVHGGVTWAQQIGPRYWLGFDCTHWQDFAPALVAQLVSVGFPRESDPFARETYRDFAFAVLQTAKLANQVAELSSYHIEGVQPVFISTDPTCADWLSTLAPEP